MSHSVDFNFVERTVHSHLKLARENNHRLTIVLDGERIWGLGLARQLCLHFNTPDPLWITDHQQNSGQTIAVEKTRQMLGQEFGAIVFDAHCGFDPDAFGAVLGTLSGGGIFILLIPELESLHQFQDPYTARMAIWPYKATDVGGRFLRRLGSMLKRDPHLIRINNKVCCDIELVSESVAPEIVVPDKSMNQEPGPCATNDQVKAVAAIEHVLHGHRRRPLVITSDRGRGKSAALGIAAANMLRQGIQHIIVTAPALNTVNAVFKHAQQLIPEAKLSKGSLLYGAGRIEFIAPDLLCQGGYSAQLLLVDEAAAIPVPMLERLLLQFSRIVYSSTVHGYEGTGRGFAVRFYSILDEVTPNWRQIKMSDPIRWADGDPLEQLAFEVLLLNAAPVAVDKIASAELDQCHFEKLDRNQLLEDEIGLKELFGLLVIAHYQTKPKDLRYMLDGLDLDIYVLKYGPHIIATAFVEKEGALVCDIATQVYQNRRRVRGHLLPQTLETFVGLQGASKLKYLRVIRIAVHPNLTRRGFASQLLQEICLQATKDGVDFVGANFGATAELLLFWKKNGFFPLHVGMKRNASSGTHAVSVLMPLTTAAQTVCERSRHKMTRQFPVMLAEQYATLQPDLVIELLLQLDGCVYSINSMDLDDIESFSSTLRGYDIVSTAVWKLTVMALSDKDVTLEKTQLHALILKVLQKQPWSRVVDRLGLSGRAELILLLRQSVATMLHWYGKTKILAK